MTLPRKFLWLIAIAFPIVVMAVLATWMVVMRYRAARDQLGSWNLTIRDSHGVPIGHGRLDLVATAWNPRWMRAAPFVAFLPTLADDAGRFTLDATGAAALNHDLQLLDAAAPHGANDQIASPPCAPGEYRLSTSKYEDGKGLMALNLSSGFALNFAFDQRRPPPSPFASASGDDRPEDAFFKYTTEISR
jgi:hypothetical protein